MDRATRIQYGAHTSGKRVSPEMQNAIFCVAKWFEAERPTSDSDDIQEGVNYIPSEFITNLPSHNECLRDFDYFPSMEPRGPRGVHLIGGVPAQLHPPSWIRELRRFKPSANLRFLLDGILYGFPIVDENVDITLYDCKNYKSALEGPAFDFIDELFYKEIAENKIVHATEHPVCIHAIGAVPKGTDKFRPITDCRRPIGFSVNNFMKTTWKEFSYESVDNVTAVLNQGDYLCTVDIASAYRSVAIRPEHWKYMGLRWEIGGYNHLFNDTRLCFGQKCAPYIFSSLTNFVVDCMRSRGYSRTFCYLDDFIILENSYDSCQKSQLVLISLLGDLGFSVNWSKCSSPSKKCTYLGIEIDSDVMQIALPGKKMEKLHSELKFFENKARATKKQIQRLTGILCHCAKVIRGARIFSRRVVDLLKGLPEKNVRITLTDGFLSDMTWWRKFSSTFNGVSFIIHDSEKCPTIFSDASFTGYSVVSDQDWIAGFFNTDKLPPDILRCNPFHLHWVNICVSNEFCKNINVLEIIPILLAVNRFGERWANSVVTWYSDNLQVVHSVNKGSSTNAFCMEVLRYVFWVSVVYNFHLKCKHVPGSENKLADRLSRVNYEGPIFQDNDFICCSIPPRARCGNWSGYHSGVEQEYSSY